MLMMRIGLDAGKINAEAQYSLTAMRHTIESAFDSMGLQKAADEGDDIVYRGTGSSRDYGRFGKIVNTLKKQPWFMDNISVWRMYNSDDADAPNEFNEEDLLLHYRSRRKIGA